MKTDYKNYYKDHYKINFTEADIDSWNKWFDAQWRIISKKIVIKKNMKVLEIGPGFGGFYDRIKDVPGLKYTGLDLDPKIVSFTNKHFKTDVFKYDSIENLNTKDKFDLIVAFEVLEHIEAPGDVIDTVASLLKPKGVFCGSTPYPFTKNIVSDETHISVLHPQNWARLFRRAGFRKVTVEAMSFAPFAWRVHKKLNLRIPMYVKIKGFVSTTLIVATK
ncbi:MAG: class I SAM-dependent methyltransferase [Candidatus Saccharibacteria bacterium]|nr:class I SAM-dependent methyltransferase [Candidatus Saccharibacteria bacterium]